LSHEAQRTAVSHPPSGEKARRNPRMCECANPDCVEMIELSVAEYESIRSSPTRFPVKPGYLYLEFERVVEENGHYIVVEVFGEAAKVVTELDPRSQRGRVTQPVGESPSG